MLASPVLQAQAAPEPQLEAAYREVVGIASVGGAVLRTRVLRPQGQGPFPVAIISHGSPADPAQRPVMAVPTFAALSNWLLQRGYVAALPLRRGYGETGGTWAENYGSCRDPNFHRAGLTSAEDIKAAIAFFRARAEVARERVLLIGYSAGGWGSLATASPESGRGIRRAQFRRRQRRRTTADRQLRAGTPGRGGAALWCNRADPEPLAVRRQRLLLRA